MTQPTIDVDALKARANILDAAERLGFHVARKGRNFTTAEHDSLVLYPADNSWYRYATGDGGDVIEFVRYWLHCDFRAACEYLDRLAVMPAAPVTPRPAPPPPPPIPPATALRYHNAMTADDWRWWALHYGVSDAAIARFVLGVCRDGRFAPVTYTIPVYAGGVLVNIKHRIPDAPAGSKYRNHQAGVGAQLYNGDSLTPDLRGVVIVAGELKAVVLEDYGLPAVSSTAGCGSWRPEWTARLENCQRIYIAFDPEPASEQEHARKLAAAIGERARLVELDAKPDDFIHAHGPEVFRARLKTARTLAQAQTWDSALSAARAQIRI